MASYWDAIQHFTNELNNHRAYHGLRPLQVSRQLCEDCQKHNEWMVNNHCFQHSDRNVCDLRENIGVKTFFGCVNYFNEAKCILDMWLSCPQHRDNLFSPGSELGLALYIHHGKIYATYRIS